MSVSWNSPLELNPTVATYVPPKARRGASAGQQPHPDKDTVEMRAGGRHFKSPEADSKHRVSTDMCPPLETETKMPYVAAEQHNRGCVTAGPRPGRCRHM